ncbi:hypothetical protein K1T71_002050 [Dendrolimus kikuchii]|uniref:Uncharacterized protein n=2 Tax=Dendrolimus kikuchii TaxID=765133 RepID=A0ACC1DFN6_9NEOP|nr:hypothetical protein K1T71_012811 [Dendrolimus kikuchii]KAJ0182681.1 hypothetical protein K1T71_002050 [Dendrolimus kikuchii]
MICSACNVKCSDGVECSSCKNKYDFSCAGISETGYRRLGAERRAAWKCSSCRISSPIPMSPGGEQMDAILGKLNDMALKLECLPSLISDVKGIKSNMELLQSSNEEAIKKIQEFASRVDAVESRIASVEMIADTASDTKAQMDILLRNDISRDQWSRMNNAEIKGIPFIKSENLFSILEKIGIAINYKVDKSQINYISRIPTFNNKEKSVIVSFLNRYIKEDFVAAARAKKSLLASALGFADSNQRVFVNDHLSPEYKKLLTKTKSVAKEKGFQYVWVKFSKIHVRKNDTSHVLTINSPQDLLKLK